MKYTITITIFYFFPFYSFITSLQFLFLSPSLTVSVVTFFNQALCLLVNTEFKMIEKTVEKPLYNFFQE